MAGVTVERQAGETEFQYQCRLQQANPPTSGPNQQMAEQWLEICAKPGFDNRPLSGFSIK